MTQTQRTIRRTALYASALALLFALGLALGERAPALRADAQGRAPEAIAASRDSALVRAAEIAAPSVVSIGAERVTYVRRGAPVERGFFPFFEPMPFYQKALRKTPYLGSGIAVDHAGHIVTNSHVVEDAQTVFVTLADGEEYEAEVLGVDPVRDIAVLKVDASAPLHPGVIGDSDDVRLGEWVMAIGNPYGPLIADPSPTITAGVVGARNRFFRSTDGAMRLYEGMIQTDAAINPGNSGGALVNAAGEIVGMNTFIFSESGGSDGIGFAIPINQIKETIDEVRRYGRLREVRVDFQPVDVTPRVRRLLGLEDKVSGALVYSMRTDGAAEAAGLKPGDVVLAVDGEAVGGRRDLLMAVHARHVGERVRLDLLRDGEKTTLEYEIPEKQHQP